MEKKTNHRAKNEEKFENLAFKPRVCSGTEVNKYFAMGITQRF